MTSKVQPHSGSKDAVYCARVLDAAPHNAHFTLAEEVALSISYNGINYAVMLVSPNDLDDFIVGFSLTNGIIDDVSQLYGINFESHQEHINAEVELASRAFWALKEKRRHIAGASGCGLCGAEALAQALPELTPVPAATLPSSEQLGGLRDKISAAQQLAKHSGALHAALYLNASGEVLACREDIGRHNAFDKLIGAIEKQKLRQPEGMVVLTSRCSLELVQKAVRSQLPLLVTLSAPTALTVDWARRYGVTLIHAPKHAAPRVYSQGNDD